MKSLLTFLAVLCLSSTIASAQLVDDDCNIVVPPGQSAYPTVPDCGENLHRDQSCIDAAQQAYYAAVYQNSAGTPTAASQLKAACEAGKAAGRQQASIDQAEEDRAIEQDIYDYFNSQCILGDPVACTLAADALAEIQRLDLVITSATHWRGVFLARQFAAEFAGVSALAAANQAYITAMENCCIPDEEPVGGGNYPARFAGVLAGLTL